MDQPPELLTRVPGPRSLAYSKRLAAVECPGVTSPSNPTVIWDRARGSNVIDVDGNRYVDLLAGFGVAALGYGRPEITEVLAQQADALSNSLGDVYPARIKTEMLETLCAMLPDGLDSAILSMSGSDAVESALKTALRVTGRPGVIAFEGAYHGLGFGALDATHRSFFREPFESRLPHQTRFVPYGDIDAVKSTLQDRDIGAILVEPIQGRGGMRPAPFGFLSALRELADASRVMLIVDEVYTGLGRTGRMLACEHDDVTPDLALIGKALGAGLPISACVGRAEIMAGWGESQGEALHTHTHMGYPLGCAVAKRVLELIATEKLIQRADSLGRLAIDHLTTGLKANAFVREVRGRGLFIGIELDRRSHAETIMRDALQAGWILICEGEEARVLSLAPPLTIGEAVFANALDYLIQHINALS